MLIYHGTARCDFSIKEGIYLTASLDLALWYANNSAEEFGGEAAVYATDLQGLGCLLDTDTMEWIGYEASELIQYKMKGYSFLYNQSMTEILSLLDMPSFRLGFSLSVEK